MNSTVIRERLARARDAYDRLMTGQATRVLVDQSGERVEYTAVKASDLANYIRDLEAQLDAATGGRTIRGPLRFMW